jgi:hypothetical protein
VLRRISLPLLRTALGLVFVWFGALKITGDTPVGDLVAGVLPALSESLLVLALGVVEVARADRRGLAGRRLRPSGSDRTQAAGPGPVAGSGSRQSSGGPVVPRTTRRIGIVTVAISGSVAPADTSCSTNRRAATRPCSRTGCATVVKSNRRDRS